MNTETKTLSRSELAAKKRIEALELRLKKIEEDKKRIEEARKAQAERLDRIKKDAATPRKIANRQKMIIGAMIWEECSKNPKVDAQIKGRLATWLTRDRDRELFGLPPLTAAPPPPEEPKTDAQ